MFCGADNIMQNILIFNMNGEIFCIILLVPHNTIMDANNVMITPLLL